MGLFKSLLYNTEFQSVEPDQRFNFMLQQMQNENLPFERTEFSSALRQALSDSFKNLYLHML